MNNKNIGIVYKSTGSWYNMRSMDGEFLNARIKGKLKIDEDISSTNPIAVGDKVEFEIENEEQGTAIIKNILPRENYIVRVSPHNKNQKHIVAANLDAALIMATIAEPRTSQGFIDRFLITAEAYHIPAIIVINKVDLLKPKHKEQFAEWKAMYEGAGYEVFPVVALEHDSIKALEERLKGITTLFSGHSGVGKSTLINQLIPGISLATHEVSGYSGKGQHTTTFAEMFDLPKGGRIIDTPGVKEFGLIDIEREELSHYFPEMRAVLQQCKFNNCLHTNEPGCAVKQAVNDGVITVDRYVSYMTIMDTIEKQW
ncbi:MAG: ribosome small subunit-dependent GTPase A [Bacteroidetes bacterium]|nr:ribosome small subunit-dependent GTPase A [Bacteroidota bacterium]